MDSFLTENNKEERGGGKNREPPHTCLHTNAHDHKERGADETHAHMSLKSQVTSRNIYSKIPLADKARHLTEGTSFAFKHQHI